MYMKCVIACLLFTTNLAYAATYCPTFAEITVKMRDGANRWQTFGKSASMNLEECIRDPNARLAVKVNYDRTIGAQSFTGIKYNEITNPYQGQNITGASNNAIIGITTFVGSNASRRAHVYVADDGTSVVEPSTLTIPINSTQTWTHSSIISAIERQDANALTFTVKPTQHVQAVFNGGKNWEDYFVYVDVTYTRLDAIPIVKFDNSLLSCHGHGTCETQNNLILGVTGGSKIPSTLKLTPSTSAYNIEVVGKINGRDIDLTEDTSIELDDIALGNRVPVTYRISGPIGSGTVSVNATLTVI